jgi:hypothetical protein
MQLIKTEWITFKETLNINTNRLPNHIWSSGSINTLKTDYPRSLKVSLDIIYEMLTKTEYKKGSYEEGLTSRNFCKYHSEEGHIINLYEGFCNEVIQILIQRTLRIEGGMGREVSMVDESSKNKEVCQV